MLNAICFVGRLGADPELRRTNNGTAVCSISLACDRDRKEQDGSRITDWIDTVMWRQTAEYFCKWFHKGDTVAVIGRMQSRKYTTKDGQNRTAWEVQAENIYFPGKHNATPQFGEIEDDGELPFNI